MTMSDQIPVMMGGDQWPESLGFVRLYHDNPGAQARLAKALLGLRAFELESGDPEIVEAIEVVLMAFRNHFGNFMQDEASIDPEVGGEAYKVDSRLITAMLEIAADE